MTASMVLTHHLRDSLTTSSDSNMLSRLSTRLSMGRATGTKPSDARKGPVAARISFACFHVPSRRRSVGRPRAVGGVARHQAARSEAAGEG